LAPKTGVAIGADGVWANNGLAAKAPPNAVAPSTNVRRFSGWVIACVRIRWTISLYRMGPIF
jgi:hypothetical protein